MDQFTRRIIGFAVKAGDVDGRALCCMFNQAISQQGVPTYLSSDNDPLFLYHQWQDNYQIVQVHVIDTRSGKEVTYEAYKGDIEARSFLTVTGRQVNLAEVERMELGGK